MVREVSSSYSCCAWIPSACLLTFMRSNSRRGGIGVGSSSWDRRTASRHPFVAARQEKGGRWRDWWRRRCAIPTGHHLLLVAVQLEMVFLASPSPSNARRQCFDVGQIPDAAHRDDAWAAVTMAGVDLCGWGVCGYWWWAAFVLEQHQVRPKRWWWKNGAQRTIPLDAQSYSHTWCSCLGCFCVHIRKYLTYCTTITIFVFNNFCLDINLTNNWMKNYTKSW